jgi:SAM-dependent methyltransferase
VSSRWIRIQVVDFPALINEAARILRPGGLLLSGEWGRNSVLDDTQLSPSVYAPAITQLSELLAVVLERNGPHALAEEVVPLIRASDHFTDERYVVYPVRLSLDALFVRITHVLS